MIRAYFIATLAILPLAASGDDRWPQVTDSYLQRMLAKASPYTVVIESKGPNYSVAGARAIIWTHGKRNMALRLTGQLNIVVPFTGDGHEQGVAIFNLPIDKVKALLAGDPALKAGILTATYNSGLSFQGDSLR
jgi:hypothetical protein